LDYTNDVPESLHDHIQAAGGWTALHLAAETGSVVAASLLLQQAHFAAPRLFYFYTSRGVCFISSVQRLTIYKGLYAVVFLDFLFRFCGGLGRKYEKKEILV